MTELPPRIETNRPAEFVEYYIAMSKKQGDVPESFALSDEARRMIIRGARIFWNDPNLSPEQAAHAVTVLIIGMIKVYYLGRTNQ